METDERRATGRGSSGEPAPPSLFTKAERIAAIQGCLHLRLRGCLDATTASGLTARVERHVRQGDIRIIFDLTEVFYLSSTGIDCFTAALKAVRPRGGGIVLVGLNERVRGVLGMYGFERAFAICDSLADAVVHLSPIGALPAARKSQPSTPQAVPDRLSRAQPGAAAAPDRTPPARPEAGAVPPVQVFGQPELVQHLERGGAHHTHLLSIGNPRRLFGRSGPDTRVPRVFRHHFKRILRLAFYDVEQKRHLRVRQIPRRIPRRADVQKAIRFFRQTREQASGYTIHCWQGISRSTAFALGFLFMLTGSEQEAKRLLQQIRPEAGPHQRIVQWFDEELGSNLSAVGAEIRQERLARWKKELDLTPDSLLEELPVTQDDEA